MLTDPANSQEATPDERFEIPRVIKHALGRQAIEAYVQEAIGITDNHDRATKAGDLEHARTNTFWPAMFATRGPDGPTKLAHLLGFPLFVYRQGQANDLPDSYLSPPWLSYTQDYMQPVAQLLPKLKFNRSAHRELAYHIIDQYVDLQLDLCRYGFLDTIHKLTDNYGVTSDGDLMLLDFSELEFSYAKGVQSVQQRDWEDIPNRREYTPLPWRLQAHLSQRLSDLLTFETARDTWGVSKPWDTSHSDRHALPLPFALYDPVGQMLWQQSASQENDR
jgi:hypothetical protein